MKEKYFINSINDYYIICFEIKIFSLQSKESHLQLYNIADFSFIKIWNSCQLNQFDQICIERKISRSPRIIHFEKSKYNCSYFMKDI